jgi:methionine-rich copper-binding protein CopC
MFAPPELALAHAVLVKTTPPRRAVLRQAPKQLELWFNERLEPAYSAVAVSTRSGSRVSTGAPGVDPQDPKRLTVTLPALAVGEYLVRFRVLSVDGHVAQDSFTFTVRGQ